MPPNTDSAGEEDVVLLVDDDPSNLAILRETLKSRPYRLLMAKSGEQALTIAAKARPSLVLLDIMMPGIDGYETCQQLKGDARTQAIPVIFLTAKVETDDIVRGFELGAADYVFKPFKAPELLARVRTHLELKFGREKLEASALSSWSKTMSRFGEGDGPTEERFRHVLHEARMAAAAA